MSHYSIARPPMTDPRNIAHDKKVQQEKKHRGEAVSYTHLTLPTNREV